MVMRWLRRQTRTAIPDGESSPASRVATSFDKIRCRHLAGNCLPPERHGVVSQNYTEPLEEKREASNVTGKIHGLELALQVLEGEDWLPTPLLPAPTIGNHLGIDLWLKREDCTPTGSFKLRGALVSMARLGQDLPEMGVYVASSGNYGLAIAFAAQRARVRVTVVVPQGSTPSKLDRIRLEGASVVQHGADFDTAKEFARAIAAEQGAAFWEDGAIEEMATGAGTIASELLDHSGPWDYVVVPLGNGSLLKGIAGVLKTRSPETRIVGLVPDSAPSMAHALRDEKWDESSSISTYADGLAVRVPIPDIVEDLKSLVDDVWLVGESRLLPAVRSLMELEQVMAEPSSAITVAGLQEHRREVAGKRVAAIITGAHLSPSLLPEVIRLNGLF